MPRGLSLALAALLVLSGAAAVVWRRSSGLDEAAPLAPWPVERIVRVELSRGGTRLILEKSAGRWKLQEPVRDWADDEAADDLAQALHDLTLGAAVTSDPSSASAYGLSGLGQTRVTAFVEGRAAPVLDGAFGSAALGDAALYFREERDSKVRLATGFPQELLSRQAGDYREKLLFPRSRGKLASLRLVEFVDPATAKDLDKPVLTLGPDGDPPSTWKIGALKGKFRYARCDERGVTALVADYDVAPLLSEKRK